MPDATIRYTISVPLDAQTMGLEERLSFQDLPGVLEMDPGLIDLCSDSPYLISQLGIGLMRAIIRGMPPEHRSAVWNGALSGVQHFIEDAPGC